MAGTVEDDKDRIARSFLKKAEGWRAALVRNMASRNLRLSPDDLNNAVQLAVIRVIFLRMAEDRGMEPCEQLLKLSKAADIYRHFVEDVCRKAGRKYHCGLFRFDVAADSDSEPDRLTPGLAVDDEIVAPILAGLYRPQAIGEFRTLPAEILGSVYEQFLGKTTRSTKGRQAKVQDKPKVRKAGGVFYTPAYIVDYSVKHTVGEMIAGKSPAELAGDGKGPPFRLLDMACGGGSFLLGGYQCLLNHCLKWYVENHPKKWKTAVWQPTIMKPDAGTMYSWSARKQHPPLADAHSSLARRASMWRLTIGERKRILTTHVFGVDIDARALEVTRLSLLLKLMEDETPARAPCTHGRGRPDLRQSRSLPHLDRNLKCGNSLIGPDDFSGRRTADAGLKRVHALDWKAAFPEALASGGFDCIVGNPPYIRIQTMNERAPWEVEVYKELYRAAKGGNCDMYVLFVERGLQLLNPRGRLGFILPHKFFNSRYGGPIRSIVADGRHLSHVVHFGAEQVFDGATTYTCLLFLDKCGTRKCRYVRVDDLDAWRQSGKIVEASIPARQVTSAAWNFTVGADSGLFSKLSSLPLKLGDAADIFVGLQTSADDVFIMDLIRQTPRTRRLKSKALGRELALEKDLLFPLVSGTDIDAYAPLPTRQYVLFPYRSGDGTARLLPLAEILEQIPKTAAYLIENKGRLEGREKGRFRGRDWHRFGRNQNLGIQDRAKLCVPRLVRRLHAGYDKMGAHFLDNVDVGGVTFKTHFETQTLEYLLGLLNSRLLRWYFPLISAPFRGGWRSANRQFLSLLPFRAIDFSDRSDKARHARMVALVERMLGLHESLGAADDEKSRDVFQRQIAATDAEINRIVYDLYCLTEEEIGMVEETAPRRA